MPRKNKTICFGPASGAETMCEKRVCWRARQTSVEWASDWRVAQTLTAALGRSGRWRFGTCDGTCAGEPGALHGSHHAQDLSTLRISARSASQHAQDGHVFSATASPVIPHTCLRCTGQIPVFMPVHNTGIHASSQYSHLTINASGPYKVVHTIMQQQWAVGAEGLSMARLRTYKAV